MGISSMTEERTTDPQLPCEGAKRCPPGCSCRAHSARWSSWAQTCRPAPRSRPRTHTPPLCPQNGHLFGEANISFHICPVINFQLGSCTQGIFPPCYDLGEQQGRMGKHQPARWLGNQRVALSGAFARSKLACIINHSHALMLLGKQFKLLISLNAFPARRGKVRIRQKMMLVVPPGSRRLAVTTPLILACQ